MDSLPKHKYIALIEFALHNDTFSAEDASKICELLEKEFRFVSASIFLNAYQDQSGFDPTRKLDWILIPKSNLRC